MINLLPQEIRIERMFGRRNIISLGIIIFLLITALLVSAVMMTTQQFVGNEESSLRTEIELNQQKVASLESQIKDLSTVAARLTTVDKLYESSIDFSELIPKIGSLLPAGSIINGLSLTGGNTDPLALDVSITSADLAPVLQRNLVQSELFEAADVNSITPLGDDTSTYKFSASMSVSFTGSAAAKKKLAAEAAAKAAAVEAAAKEAGGE